MTWKLKRKTSVEVACSQLGGNWLSIYASSNAKKGKNIEIFRTKKKKRRKRRRKKRKRRKKNGRWKDIRSLGSTDDCRRWLEFGKVAAKGRGHILSFFFTFFTFLGNPPLKSSNPNCGRYTHPPTMNITPLCSSHNALHCGGCFIGIG